MDFQKLITRYQQFGGLRLVRVYIQYGLLLTTLKAFFRCVFKGQSFKVIYPQVLEKIEPILIKSYQPRILERKRYYSERKLEHHQCKTIWFCWLQGLDNAPEIVKACFVSQKKYLSDREFIIIDATNWSLFVDLPDYIQAKWEKKQIPPALFSDLIRLQLLIKYGGTWIDSTVLCTGTEHTKEYLDADLFLFQYTRPGCVWSGNISNWFISAYTNNEVLMILRDVLFEYWKDFNCTIDYYIFHLFFQIVAKEYPEVISTMPYGYSLWSLTLMHHWNDQYDSKKWTELVSKVSFHKLSHRINKEVEDNKQNYYNWIINHFA